MSKRPPNANVILNALQNTDSFLMGLYELLVFCQNQKAHELGEQQQFLLDCLSVIRAQNIRAGNVQLDNFVFVLRNSFSHIFNASSPAYTFVLTLLQALGYELTTAPQHTTDHPAARLPIKSQEFLQGVRRPPSEPTMMHSESDPNFNLQLLQSGMQNAPPTQLPFQFVNVPRHPQMAMIGQEDAFSAQRFAPPLNFAQPRPPASNFVFFANPASRGGYLTASPQLIQSNMGGTYLVNNPSLLQPNMGPYRFARHPSQPNFVQLNPARAGAPLVRQAPFFMVPPGKQQMRMPQFFGGVPPDQSDLVLQQLSSWQPVARESSNSSQAFIRPSSGIIERAASQPTPAHPSNDNAKPSTIHYMPSVPQTLSPHEDRRSEPKFDQTSVATSPSRQGETQSLVPADVLVTPTTIRLCNSIPMCDSAPAIELIDDAIHNLRADLQVVSCIPNSTFIEIVARRTSTTGMFRASHRFAMRDCVFEAVHSREHIEIQLKCVDLAGGVNRWPETLSLRINDSVVPVPPRDRAIGDECIVIKNRLRKLENRIDIECEVPGDCAIPHTLPDDERPIAFRFLINLVLRSTISVMLRALLNKRTQSVTKSIEFVQHYFVVNPIEMARGYTIVSFLDPMSGARIIVPVRGESCRHVQCLDFESLCGRHLNRTHFICPVCNLVSSIPNVIIDGFMCSLISRLKDAQNVSQVKITPECNWTLLTQTPVESRAPDPQPPAPAPQFELSNEDLIAIFGGDAPAAFVSALSKARIKLDCFPELEQQAITQAPKKRSYNEKTEDPVLESRDPDMYFSEAYSSVLPKNQISSNTSLFHKSAENLNTSNDVLKKTNSFSSAPNYASFGLSDVSDLFRLPREEFIIDADPNLSLNTVAQKDFVHTPNPMKDAWDALDDDFLKHVRDSTDPHVELKPPPGLNSSHPALQPHSKTSERQNT